jgi:hypothetical protein
MTRSTRLLALLLAGAVPSAAAQRGADNLLAAERALAEISEREGFAAAFARGLAPGGALLWPGAPVAVGAAQVASLLGAQRLLDSLRISWQPLAVEVARDSAFGFTWGVASVVRAGGLTRLGRYIAVWRLDQGRWTLAAFVGLGLTPPAATTLPASFGPARLPALRPSGLAAHFIAADLAFAKLAGDSGASVAFTRWAAPDAITFGGGLLTRGPEAIGRAVGSPRPSHWEWHPVVAGASADGDLGFTVGESIIATEGSPTSHGKYLTLWRRGPSGEVRYLTDGGNARPPAP